MNLYLLIDEHYYDVKYTVVRAGSEEEAKALAKISEPSEIRLLSTGGDAEVLWSVEHSFEGRAGEDV